MSEPFIAEIRAFGCNFAPRGWAFCDGQIIGIAQNTALFSLLGTTYGGNGQTTFALPDLRGRSPMHWGNGAGLSPYVIGEMSGTPTVTLLQTEMPSHAHVVNTATATVSAQAVGTPTATTFIGNSKPDKLFSDASPAPNSTFSIKAIGIAGGSQPHNNMQPYLAINFCIATEGIFPARN